MICSVEFTFEGNCADLKKIKTVFSSKYTVPSLRTLYEEIGLAPYDSPAFDSAYVTEVSKIHKESDGYRNLGVSMIFNDFAEFDPIRPLLFKALGPRYSEIIQNMTYIEKCCGRNNFKTNKLEVAGREDELLLAVVLDISSEDCEELEELESLANFDFINPEDLMDVLTKLVDPGIAVYDLYDLISATRKEYKNEIHFGTWDIVPFAEHN